MQAARPLELVMDNSVIIVQHAEPEKPGLIAEALKARGYFPDLVRTHAGGRVPSGMGGAAGLVIMGGPMGVYEHERYPFIRDEMRLIEQALREEKPVLGICLGSQLLAATLGGDVKRGKQKEIGWHSVALTDSASGDAVCKCLDRSFVACHWHGDVFDLPSGAVCLASSRQTAFQAFRYDKNAYGLLFHMEITEEILRGMVATFANELAAEGLDGGEILQQSQDHLPRLDALGRRAFSEWAALLADQRQ